MIKHKLYEENNQSCLLSWDEILLMFDEYDRKGDACMALSDEQQKKLPKAWTSNNAKDRKVSHATSFILHDVILTHLERCYPFSYYLNLENIRHPAHLYFSFVSDAISHGIHKDPISVWHWQQTGVTQWTIYENNQKFTYNLTPGDILWVPAGVYHGTKPLTPRAGLSFGLKPELFQEFKDNLPPDSIHHKYDLRI
jgi:hypothetical protein